MTKPSFILHTAFRDAQDKFDHFILAAVLAVCAYLAQTMKFGQIGANIETLFLISLLVFGMAAICGFKRIEWWIVAYNANHTYLEHIEHQRPEQAVEVQTHMISIADKAMNYYRLRNTLMMCGFLSYLFAKIFATYVGQ